MSTARLFGFGTSLALAAILLVLSVPPVSAEIYQWADESGTIHFTDDIASVPASVRGKARLLLREAPITIPAPPSGDSSPVPVAAS